MIDSIFIVVFGITILIWFISSYTTMQILLIDGLHEERLKRLEILSKINIITTIILIASFVYILWVI